MNSCQIQDQYRIFSVLRNFVLCSICSILFACAGGDIKQDEDTYSAKKITTYTDIDSDVEADFEAAVALLKAERYSQAIEVLKTVIEREQRLPAPYVNIAMAYTKTDDTKLAEENLIHALKLDIGHPEANNELGLLYRKAGKFKAARVAYQNAIKEHPDYLPAKRNLGVLCDIYMHDYVCALEQFENYLKLSPDDKTVAIWVVDVKSRLGK